MSLWVLSENENVLSSVKLHVMGNNGPLAKALAGFRLLHPRLASFRPHQLWARPGPNAKTSGHGSGPCKQASSCHHVTCMTPAFSQQLPCFITNLTWQGKASSAPQPLPPAIRQPLLGSTGLSSAQPPSCTPCRPTCPTALQSSRMPFPDSLEIRHQEISQASWKQHDPYQKHLLQSKPAWLPSLHEYDLYFPRESDTNLHSHL